MTWKSAIIGTGNIASHFAPAIQSLEFITIDYVLSRKYASAIAFGSTINAKALKKLSEIPSDIDVVFLMINDDELVQVASALSKHLQNETVIVHFSGTQTLEAIPDHFENKAIIWPIQSISKQDKDIVLKEIPLTITSSNEQASQVAAEISKNLSQTVIELKEEDKMKLHLAAVLVNNFSNHFYTIADQFLKETDQSFDILLPIIQHTTRKLNTMPPLEAQTGPAVRRDMNTINKHLDILNNDDDLQEIYRLVTRHIMKKHSK